MGLVVSTPGPKVALGSDGEGVVVSGTNSNNVGRESTDRGRLVCVLSHAQLGSGQSESTVAAISKAHDGGATAAHPSLPVILRPHQMDPTFRFQFPEQVF